MADALPSVSLEDLHAFQARHFIVHNHELDQDYSTQAWDEQEDPGNEGLGSYADGVKRTLTNEQIEIFRHSEIQALLREKRLEAQALAEDAGNDLSGTSEDDVAPAKSDVDQGSGSSPNRMTAKNAQKVRQQDGTAGKEIPDTARNQTDSTEDSQTAITGQSQSHDPDNNPPQLFSRRIITYDD